MILDIDCSTPEQYHSTEGFLNYSKLKRFAENPNYLFEEVEVSRPMEIGKAFEDLLMTKVFGFENDYIVAPEARKNSKVYKEFEEANQNKKILSQSEFTMLESMVENSLQARILGFPLAEILKASQIQLPVFWEVEGVRKKALIDFCFEYKSIVYLFDFKTSCKPIHEFMRDVNNHKYYLQAVHYKEALEQFYPTVSNMNFFVSSKQKPHLSQIWTLTERARNLAQQHYQTLVEQYFTWKNTNPEFHGFESQLGVANIYI